MHHQITALILDTIPGTCFIAFQTAVLFALKYQQFISTIPALFQMIPSIVYSIPSIA